MAGKSPSMYDLAFSTNANARAQTKLAGATFGSILGQSVAQGKNHRETMEIQAQQIEAIEHGFAEVSANQQRQIENQYAIIQNQAVQTRAIEGIQRELVEVNDHLAAMRAQQSVTNRGAFASWRQSDEGRIYMAWERAATWLLGIRDARDAIVRDLPSALWADTGLGDPPTAESTPPQKPARVVAEQVPPVGGMGVAAGIAIAAGLVSAVLGVVTVVYAARDLGGSYGTAIMYAIIAALLILGAFSGLKSRLEKRAKVLQSNSQVDAKNAVRHDEYVIKLNRYEYGRGDALSWGRRYKELVPVVGCAWDSSAEWMSADDREHFEWIEIFMLQSRENFPLPEELPALYLPEAHGDRATRVGRAILMLNGGVE